MAFCVHSDPVSQALIVDSVVSPNATCPAGQVLLWTAGEGDWFPALTSAEGTQIAGAVLAVWAVAWVLKTLRRFINES